MSARVSVRLPAGSHEAVAVKTAMTPEEATALAHEADRLRRARHPGVVSLLGHVATEDGAELHTRFAGEPLDRWRGTLPRLAGLGAAVAATLADLHERGILHGRLNPSHVLVSVEGRPRLCGFSPAADGATPADDVAALGRVLGALAERVPLSERRGLLAWRRGALAERRAFGQLVARATDPVPGRRPTARALATALLAAVTDAELPPGGARGAEPRSAHDAPSLPAGARGAKTRSAFDTEVPDAGAGPAEPGSPTDGELPRSGARPVDADASTGAGVPPGGAPGAGPTGPGATGIDATDDDATDDGETGLDEPGADDQSYDTVFGDQTQVGVDELFADRPWPDIPDGAAGGGGRGRPARTRSGAGRRRVATRAAVVAAAAAGCTGLLLWVDAPGPRGTGRDGSQAAPTAPAGPDESTSSATTCPPAGADGVESGDGIPAAQADVDGDGCVEPLDVDGTVVEVAGERWAVGQPDDTVAIGDWDCDGVATPAVYRPATGDVFLFPAWASPGEPVTVEPVAQVAGGRRLTVAPASGTPDGCDAPAVELATGALQPVEVAP